MALELLIAGKNTTYLISIAFLETGVKSNSSKDEQPGVGPASLTEAGA